METIIELLRYNTTDSKSQKTRRKTSRLARKDDQEIFSGQLFGQARFSMSEAEFGETM